MTTYAFFASNAQNMVKKSVLQQKNAKRSTHKSKPRVTFHDKVQKMVKMHVSAKVAIIVLLLGLAAVL